jgi:hypothetical protein
MIQTGAAEYGPQTSGWNLNTGTGERTFLSPDIKFHTLFSTPPNIMLALSGIDSEHTTNLRVTVTPYDVEADEFNIMIKTWGDTLIYSVLVTWIAHD